MPIKKFSSKQAAILNFDQPTLFDLSDWQLICINGPDAKKLLQGQLTVDVLNLAENTLQLAAHCNPQGRVISLFYLFLDADNYYLLLPKEMTAITIQALKKYAVFYKVNLTEIHDKKAMGFMGDTKQLSAKKILLMHSTNRAIIVDDAKAFENSSPFPKTSSRDWKILNMLDGIAGIYPETSGKLLPHELNLPALSAVNFEKGCYTGQEIIARMHYRGKLKNHLYQVTFESTTKPLPLETLYLGDCEPLKSIGLLVDFVEKAYNHYIGLVLLEDQYASLPMVLGSKKTMVTIVS